MTLSAYFKREGAMNLTTLSGVVGVSKGRLSQLRDSTDWPAELAMKVEAATNGQVNAADISPVVALARQVAA